MESIICGIQQMGVGIPNVHEASKFYKSVFGFTAPIIDDKGTAELMLPYTNGKPQDRHAILALNMKGGGGMEIWQYASRTPLAPDFVVRWGDLGILACKLKCEDVEQAYQYLKDKHIECLCAPTILPDKTRHFYAKDLYGNIFECIEGLPMFTARKHPIGGVAGAVIGVTDMEASKKFYKEVLGYDTIVFDTHERFDEAQKLPGGPGRFHRVLLSHSQKRQGPFSELLGPSLIELVQADGFEPRRIFKDRQWGDLGFIHLCFDVKGMDLIKQDCAQKGYPFTVDTAGHFDMGVAAGRFAYLEDPNGTLIELVETYKIPIMKRLGWFIDLRKKDPKKPLAKWMLKMLG